MASLPGPPRFRWLKRSATRRRIASSQRESGNHEQGPAERELQEALRLDPTNLSARLSLGSLYADQKEFQKAMDQWKEVLRLDPSNAEARANLKWLEGQGERRDAK